MTPEAVAARLISCLSAPAIGLSADTKVAVALSGGVDSTLLLHAVAKLIRVARLRALHIDHGLQPDSQRWSAQCRTQAESLGAAFVARRVEIDRASAQSLEESARRARYAALAEMLEPGEVLLTAHHADDQLETLLYRLFRGTGIRGLQGIAERDVFGSGYIARPLLCLTRVEIRSFATDWGLAWSEDPSNIDTRFDRNYLRHHVVPLVLARWPRAAHAAQRLTRAARDSEEIQAAMAHCDIVDSGATDRLVLARLRTLPRARQRNLLRHAARELTLGVPNARPLARLLELIDEPQTKKSVQWPGGEAHVYRDHLFLLPPASRRVETVAARLSPGTRIELARGAITLEPVAGAGLPDSWASAGLEVGFRRGGERFWPSGAPQDRALKDWFQEQHIVPWMRRQIPLIKHDGVIVAIADLALSDQAAQARKETAHWRVVWHGKPRIT